MIKISEETYTKLSKLSWNSFSMEGGANPLSQQGSFLYLDETGWGLRKILQIKAQGASSSKMSGSEQAQELEQFRRLESVLELNSWLPSLHIVFRNRPGEVEFFIEGTQFKSDFIPNWSIIERTDWYKSLLVEFEIDSDNLKLFYYQLSNITLMNAIYCYEKGRGLVIP